MKRKRASSRVEDRKNLLHQSSTSRSRSTSRSSQLDALLNLLNEFNHVVIDQEGNIHYETSNAAFASESHMHIYSMLSVGKKNQPALEQESFLSARTRSSINRPVSMSSSLKTIHRMLQTRGTLTEMLTSNHALETIACDLSDSSLCVLLSCLYQSEMCCTRRTSHDLDNDDDNDDIDKNPHSNADMYDGLDVLKRKKLRDGTLFVRKGSPSSSTSTSSYLHAQLLRFLDRVLVRRYPSLQKMLDRSCSCIFDAWSSIGSGNTDASTESHAARFDREEAGIDADIDIRSHHPSSWIPSMIFMMAYSGLRTQLTCGTFTSTNNVIDTFTDTSPDENGAHNVDENKVRTKEEKLRNVKQDPIIRIAIRIIFFSKILANASESSQEHIDGGSGDNVDDNDNDQSVGGDESRDHDMNHTPTSIQIHTGASNNPNPTLKSAPNRCNRENEVICLKVFENEMKKVENLIGSIQNACSSSSRSSSSINTFKPKKNVQYSKEEKGDEPMLKLSSSSLVEESKVTGSSVPLQEKSMFEKLWDEVHAQDSSSCDEIDEGDKDKFVDTEGKPTIGCRIEFVDDDASQKVRVQSVNDIGAEQGRDEVQFDNGNVEMSESPPSNPGTKDYTTTALEVRSSLLQMSHNAVSNEVEIMSKRIVSILEEAGSQDGVDGIVAVIWILKSGSTVTNKEIDNGNLNVGMSDYSFSDAMVSSVSKAYITNSLSASRVSAYFKSFILPSLSSLNDPKSRPASRQLVNTLTFLARDRPTECINAIFIPILICHRVGNNEMKEASKAQCELINRIIKTISDSDLPMLISGLIPMKITESSITILTTCVQKKPTLNDSIIIAMVEKIKICCDEIDLVKKTKFSSFFHAFVNKYGSQLHKLGCTNDLLEASEKLKTFLRKAVASALNKLNR